MPVTPSEVHASLLAEANARFDTQVKAMIGRIDGYLPIDIAKGVLPTYKTFKHDPVVVERVVRAYQEAGWNVRAEPDQPYGFVIIFHIG